jgi:hypothetical protein
VTHFETMLVEAIRDLSKEVHECAEICARLDERSKGHERRLGDLEEHTPPPSTSRKRRLHVAKDVGLTAGSVVALATAALSFFKDPPPPPPPPPTAQVHVPAVTGAP